MKLVACFSWRILPILLSCQDCGFVIRAVKYMRYLYVDQAKVLIRF